MPKLSNLLRFARGQLRLRRARHWMMLTSFGLAAIALAATLVDQPYACLFLLPVVPIAGVVGYCRRSPSDGLLALVLDQHLHTRELLASGIACREREDDAGKMIAAQAEVCAAGIDRRQLRSEDAITRSEAAAGLLLLIALLAGVTLRGPIGLSSKESRLQATSGSTTLRSLPEQGTATPDRPRKADPQPTADGHLDAPEESSTASARGGDPSRRPNGDASGEGQAQTASRVPNALPPVRSQSAMSSDTGSRAVAAATSGLVDVGTDRPTASGLANRAPLNVDQTAAPSPTARQQAQAALYADQIDLDVRDLVKAYFDLDAPR